MKVIENDCTEEKIAKDLYDEGEPETSEGDLPFVKETSGQMFNLLLLLTKDEANAVVRRCQGHGWLAWKRLTSFLNPRTLASGVKAISAVLPPGKINKANRADSEIDLCEDRLSRLHSEYG